PSPTVLRGQKFDQDFSVSSHTSYLADSFMGPSIIISCRQPEMSFGCSGTSVRMRCGPVLGDLPIPLRRSSQLFHSHVPMLLISSMRTSFLLPEAVGHDRNLRVKGCWRVSVIDPAGETALVVAAIERRVQVEYGVPFVRGQGQAEAGQA